MKFLSVFMISGLSFSAIAAIDINKEALKYVPNGKVEAVEKNEAKVRTSGGTIVEVEFDRNGNLEEASGDMASKDTFVPGNGLLSLTDAVAAMKKAGKNVDGEWSLEKDFARDWEYEFEGFENGKSMEYTLNAKTGKITGTKEDT